MRLRVGIAVVFLAVMLPLTAGMVGILYRQNSQLAFDMAESAMDRATEDVVAAVQALLDPIARAVDMTVAYGKAQGEDLRQPQAMRPLVEILDQVPALYSIYVGAARDGAFFQAARLPPGIRAFGPHGRPPPETARFAVRRLDASSGEARDSYVYLAKWGEVVGVERGPVRYDPRQRPWYDAAARSAGVVNSGVYIFSGTGQPGLTLSKQLVTDDGERLGVVGADLSLDALAQFLASRRVGRSGVVFILDENGRLIGHPRAELIAQQTGDGVSVVKGEEVADRVVADAVRLRNGGAGGRFKAPLGAEGALHLVSFTPFPESFGRNWTIGAVAAEADFVGPLRQASALILTIGAVFIGLATLAIIWLSRLLTRPIHALIAETERIRHLDLDGTPAIRSRITEVDSLAAAMVTMKTALRSFGAYVPKALVQSIVASGVGTDVGGERRPLTVMFTDLENFAAHAEGQDPEALLERLSQYFEIMARAVHASGGTTDKFMGDAVMALWNAPAAHPDHVAAGCLGMLAARDAGAAFNAALAPGARPFVTRFGLHTGVAVAGNVGSRDRMQYTALGATVNLAARIESLNKHYGTQLLVSGAVEEATRGRFLYRPVDLVVPYGMSAPVPLFELLGTLEDGAPHPASDADRARCREWEAAYALVHGREWAGAVERLSAFAARWPGDPLCTLLLARCRRCVDEPPPSDWDGAFRFQRK
ncbi:cache domain-containing protein [Azospirillum sp.]|uniref:cache domain-containing protein n=1 Tax=Azospirillum sp. TaxID=34012 RepID=UPI003D7272D4